MDRGPYYFSTGGYPEPSAALQRYREEKNAEAIRKAQAEAEKQLRRRELEDAAISREAATSFAGGYEDQSQQMSVPERVYGRADIEAQQSVPETEEERRLRAAREFDQRGWIGLSEHARPQGYIDEDRGMSLLEPLEAERLRAARGEIRTEDMEYSPPEPERRGRVQPERVSTTTESGTKGTGYIPSEDELWLLEQQLSDKERERRFLLERDKWLNDIQQPNTGAVSPPEPPISTKELLGPSVTPEQEELMKLQEENRLLWGAS